MHHRFMLYPFALARAWMRSFSSWGIRIFSSASLSGLASVVTTSGLPSSFQWILLRRRPLLMSFSSFMIPALSSVRGIMAGVGPGYCATRALSAVRQNGSSIRSPSLSWSVG